MTQLAEIEKLIAKNERALRSNKAKEGVFIRTTAHGNGWQYYFSNGRNDRKYARVSEVGKVREIVEREYEQELQNKLIILRDSLKAFLLVYDVSIIDETYFQMSKAKQALIKPIIMTDEEYIDKWIKEYSREINSYPKSFEIETKRGERVRSKSEKIIADLLNDCGIPYVYEPKIKLGDGKYCCPDFAVLNVRTRKTYFWEHLGLIDDENYASKNMIKLLEYERNGIDIGEVLLTSYETKDIPLDLKVLKRKIKKYLL